MYVCASVRPCSLEEVQLKRVALRDAIICLGWIKVLSVFFYVALFLVVKAYSEGTVSTVITSSILAIIPLQVTAGLLFFLGAVDIKIFPLRVAIGFCLLIAALNTALGLVGAIYFIRTGFLLMHFFTAAAFGILSLSFCSVLFHDIIITLMFIKMIECPPSLPPDPASFSQ